MTTQPMENSEHGTMRMISCNVTRIFVMNNATAEQCNNSSASNTLTNWNGCEQKEINEFWKKVIFALQDRKWIYSLKAKTKHEIEAGHKIHLNI